MYNIIKCVCVRRRGVLEHWVLVDGVNANNCDVLNADSNDYNDQLLDGK